MMKLFLVALSLVSALFSAEASPSFGSLESSKGHGHHRHPHQRHHHHHRSSSSSSSSHHHHHHDHHHHECPQEILVTAAVANTKNLQNLIVADDFAPILDLAFPSASVLLVTPSCLTPLNGCCKSTLPLADWLALQLLPTVKFINQIPESNVKILPCGSIVVTAVQVITTDDPLEWKVAQVEFTWKKTYGCNLKLSSVKSVDSACVGKVVNTLCSSCNI